MWGKHTLVSQCYLASYPGSLQPPAQKKGGVVTTELFGIRVLILFIGERARRYLVMFMEVLDIYI